jgi:hypothetical protein
VPLHLQPPPPVPAAHFQNASRKFRRTASRVALALGLTSSAAAASGKKKKKSKGKKLKKTKSKQSTQFESSSDDHSEAANSVAAAATDLHHLSQLTLSVEQLAALLQRVVSVGNSVKNTSANVSANASAQTTPFNTPFGKPPVTSNSDHASPSHHRSPPPQSADYQSHGHSHSQPPSHQTPARHSDAWNEIAAVHAAHERAALNEAGFQSAVAYYSHDESAAASTATTTTNASAAAQFASPATSTAKRRSIQAASSTASSSSLPANVPWSPVPALLRPNSPVVEVIDPSSSSSDDASAAAAAAIVVDAELADKAHAAYAEPSVDAYLPLRVMLPRQLVVLGGEIPFVFYKMVAVVGNRCASLDLVHLAVFRTRVLSITIRL